MRVLGYTLMFVLLNGCGETTTGPAPATQSQPEAVVSNELLVDRALELWRKGDKDKAAAVFLEITEWSENSLTSDDSPLAMSEKSFAALPESGFQDLMESLQGIRSLCRYIIAKATQVNQANPAKATAILEQVESCGKWLDSPDRTLMAQQFGKALQLMASKELEE